MVWTKFKKVKYTVIKLSGKANQYWINLENRRAARSSPPINTWDGMKERLETKYVPPSFSAHLMDNWHQHTQGNKSAKEYVKKFDEFIIRCSTLHRENEAQILSRFRVSLKENLRTELLAREVNELEAAYVLVQDLDSARTNRTFNSHDYRASMSRPSLSPQPNRSSTQIPSHRDDIKGKNLELDNRNKGLKSSKVSFTTKFYKFQDYGHLAVSCHSLVRITIIDETLTEVTELDSDVYIFKWEDSETGEEPTSDDIGLNYINQTPSTHLSVVRCVPSQQAENNDWRKSATFHTFTKIRDKSYKVIMDNESYINAISSKSLKYFGLEVVPHPHQFKVSWIDFTTLEVKQQCLVRVNFNHHKDKIWCDVTMNVGQVILSRPWLFDKKVTIYDRSNMC